MMNSNFPTGTVTFLFTDIEGSTHLWERYPEAMKAALARHDGLLRQAIESNSGRVIKTTSDGCHAVFASAAEGMLAAVAAQKALLAEPWAETSPVKVRMALHTGEAELREGDYYGPALNRAARLMAVAHGGQVLLSAITADLVQEQLPAGTTLRDLGEHRLKDLVRSERVFQLALPDLPADFPPLKSLNAFPNNLPIQLTSFVGRENRNFQTVMTSELGHIARHTGDMKEARRIYQETIRGWQDLGNRSAIAHQLECFAFIAVAEEEPERAIKLFGAAEALREKINSPMTDYERVEYDKEVAQLRSLLHELDFNTLWAEGRALTMEQAIEFALN